MEFAICHSIWRFFCFSSFVIILFFYSLQILVAHYRSYVWCRVFLFIIFPFFCHLAFNIMNEVCLADGLTKRKTGKRSTQKRGYQQKFYLPNTKVQVESEEERVQAFVEGKPKQEKRMKRRKEERRRKITGNYENDNDKRCK